MPKKQIGLSFEPEVIEALDARAEREGVSRQELIDFALQPLLRAEHAQARALILPRSTDQMLERIAAGQGVHKVDVIRRATIDYARRAAERWQINCKKEDRAGLAALQAQMPDDHDPRDEWPSGLPRHPDLERI